MDSLEFTTLDEINGGAPTLLKRGNGAFSVYEDYPWAIGGSASLKSYVPYIQLSEIKITSSAQLRQLKLSVAQNTTSTLARAVGGAIAGNGIAPVVGGVIGAALGAASAPTWVDPYNGLYDGEKTGFVYTLPYLSPDNMVTSSIGTWSKVDENKTAELLKKAGGSIISLVGGEPALAEATKLGDTLSEAYDTTKAINQLQAELANPGSSKESVKYFAPSDAGDTINTSFYLFNTTSQKEMQKNWEFLFAFNYQNLPNRKSINLMDPPSLYEVTVPGFKYFPWAYVSNFKVENIGTTRMVDITTGEVVSAYSALTNSNVKIIPEAYKVTISLQSLFINARNLFYYMYDGKELSPNSVIVNRGK